MISGYEQIYRDLLPRLLQCDLAESAGRLGLEMLANGEVSVQFCGRQYVISSVGVNPADGQPVDVNNRSVLAHYILSQGRGEPEHSFLPLAQMTGTVMGQQLQDKGLMVKPLLREFGSDYDKFQSAARKLGGVLEGASEDGGQGWTFQVLPKIPLRLVFYQADDEFPADIQMLFDRSARRFMEFECLAFLSGCFTKALIKAAKDSGTEGAEQ
jgi:hypothetical protein